MFTPVGLRRSFLASIGFAAACCATAHAVQYTIPGNTLSPDHRYGVTVPIVDPSNPNAHASNKLVVATTGKVLAVIHAKTGWNHMNDGGVVPARWTPNDSLLLWQVDGKWSPIAEVLLKLQNGKVKWQTNVLKRAQHEVLVRTRAAVPAQYAAAKQANAGNGSDFPDGFTIDVEARGAFSLPLRVRAILTSNPKQLASIPNVNSYLDGKVGIDGKYYPGKFHLGKAHSNFF